MRALTLAIATVGPTGYAPIAPGTAGSVAGLALLVACRSLASPVLEFGVLVVVVEAGIWAAGVVERQTGARDPGIVVIDEVAGMLVTLLWIPLTWGTAALGFFTFRLFDIIKPPPARRAEQLPGGWGIMMEDLCAGAYAYLIVRLALWALPSLVVT